MNKKPNILIIISDQQNIDSIAAYNHIFKHEAYHCHWVKTPNLDRIVKKGYSFIESRSVNPVSSPARSSFFTGRYTVETGVTNNGLGIDMNVPNIGEWLSKYGYYNVYCGKWHAGGRWTYPEVEGNCIVPGFETLPVGMTAPGLTGDYVDYQVSGALSGFIRNYSDEKPFFAVAGLMNPHDICYWKGKFLPEDDRFGLGEERPPVPPNQVAEFELEFKDMDIHRQLFEKRNDHFSEDEWRNYIYDYQRMIEKVDSDVGRILDAVEARNDETLVIVTSDHGEGAARHKRTEKNSPYEESLQVPLIFYLPSKVRQNVYDTSNMVSGLDIMPSICGFAGIPTPPNCRGENLWPIVTGKSHSKKRNFTISELKQTIRIVKKGDFKYVKFYQYSGERERPFVRKNDGGFEKFQPGNSRDQYVESAIKLLFNLKKDPWENENLAKDSQYSEVIDRMEELLQREYESVVIPGTSYVRQ
ncbi:sulfatase-like hydrolase/transferase [Proteiniphilum sp.]|uniref:sulfatase family protein n=1 Tax=Proteiniphilum sp. TaxID=1926877 RepID=UPI003322FACC